MVQDRRGRGSEALETATQELVAAANQTPGLAGVFSLFNTRTPKIYADIDRVKAEMLGVRPSRCSRRSRSIIGSAYVNDFNLLGRTFRVTAQADGAFRQDRGRATSPNAQGRSAWCRSARRSRPSATSPARTACRATTCIRRPRCRARPCPATRPAMRSPRWSASRPRPCRRLRLRMDRARAAGEARRQHGLLIFIASVVFVFLLLAAQYESWTLPLAVILIVPMCLLAAVSGLLLRGMDVNILAQIGFVVLVGLAAKNAILIVEFARQAEEGGADRFRRRGRAARTR